MRRVLAIAAMLALAIPTLAAAQNPPPGHGAHPNVKPGGVFKPPGGGGARPLVRPGPPGGGGGFRGARPGGQFVFRGHSFNRIHVAPFVYPPGWVYRRWIVGGLLPPVFLAPAYYYTSYAALGLEPPPPGFQWVRYGPDLILVNVATGQVADVAYGVFY